MSEQPNDQSSGGVEESGDITIIDPEKLDEEYRKILEAEKLVARKEKVEAKLGSGTRKMTETDAEGGTEEVLSEDLKRMAKEWKEYKAKVEKLEEFEDKFTDEIGKLSTFANNPMGWITRQFTDIKFIVKFIGVLAALKAFEMAIQRIVEDWLGPGGGGDVRVKVLAIVRSIPELGKILDIRSGKIFFSPVKGIFQGVGMTSNMDNKQNGMQRFTQIHGGTSMISDLL